MSQELAKKQDRAKYLPRQNERKRENRLVHHCAGCDKLAVLRFQPPHGKPKRDLPLSADDGTVSSKLRRAKMAAIISALRVTGSLPAACRQTGVALSTANSWIRKDELFAGAVSDAKAEALGILEAELMHRAVVGDMKPVVSAGKLVTFELKKSDDLLKFALKKADPDGYSERGRTIGAKMGVDKDGNKFFKVYEGFDPDQV